jgi:hypothetical protein
VWILIRAYISNSGLEFAASADDDEDLNDYSDDDDEEDDEVKEILRLFTIRVQGVVHKSQFKG